MLPSGVANIGVGARVDRDHHDVIGASRRSHGGSGVENACRLLRSCETSSVANRFRYPVVVGGGTPFLPPVTKDVPLDLIETRTFGSRVIYERYGRARDESD
jgi:hypothetical protein